MQWYDVLDLIGVSAYDAVEGDKFKDMLKGWDGYKRTARELHNTYNKPVVYTEVGSGKQLALGRVSREGLEGVQRGSRGDDAPPTRPA